MSNEIRIVAIVQALPGHEQQVATILEACVSPSRLETGCRSYALYRDQADVCRFVFIETWADQAAFSDHEKTPHFLALVEALPPHVTTDGRMMVLDPVA